MNTILKVLEAIWEWLQGKKATITALAALTITLCISDGWLDLAQAIWLNGVLIVLGITANTANYLEKK